MSVKKRDYELNAFKWLIQARESLDRGQVFNAYFSAYVALVAAATNRCIRTGGMSGDSDDEQFESKAINTVFRSMAPQIHEYLFSSEGKLECSRLRARSVDGDGDAQMIGAPRGSSLESSRDRLIDFWNPLRAPLSPREVEEQAEHLATLFRNVRNRLFHGQKSYDNQGPDADLLRCAAPILIGVVQVIDGKKLKPLRGTPQPEI